MKKTLIFIIMGMFLISLVSYTINAKEDTSKAYFKLKNDDGKKTIDTFDNYEFSNNIVSFHSSKAKINELKKNKNLEFLGYVQIYEPLAIKNKNIHIQPIKPGIIPFELNRVCKLSDYNLSQVQWDMKLMYEDSNLTKTSGGNNVKIAIIDTGVNYTHPDISSRIVYCKDFTTNPVTNDCMDSSSDILGHGTRVASVLVGNSGADNLGIYGMAPNAQLYVYKVCTGDFCADDTIASAIYDAVNNSVNIISISLGGAYMSNNLKNAIDYATDHNTLIVAAAGNFFGADSNVDKILYPAAYYKVISVGAIDQELNPWISSANGLNNGDYIRQEREIEVAAPGVAIVAAAKNGCYAYSTGTSIATPHVAGLAALLWDGNAASTRKKIDNSARIHDIYTLGDDTSTGFGLPTIKYPDEDMFTININPNNELPRHLLIP